MAITDNRSILRKADLVTGDLAAGGDMVDAQAREFIRILIDESVVMQDAFVRPMRSQKEIVDKIRFGSRILRAGTEGTALPVADRSKPDLSKVELDSKLFKAEVRLTDEVLEDQLEGPRFRQTLMQLMGEAVSRDMEEVLLQGDTASLDTFLAQLDGLIKQASTNVVDALSATLSKTLLRDMLKALPSEFHRRRSAMRFYAAVKSREDYADSLGTRETPGGDSKFTQEDVLAWRGIPVMAVPLLPEDLGGGSDESVTLLTEPRNIRVGIWRQIKLEEERLVREGATVIVATLRFDAKFEEETAVVKLINVKSA